MRAAPRLLLQGLCALGVMLGLYTITTREQPPPRATTSISELAGVRFLEQLTGGAKAGDTLPLIIGLHGRGGSPERFGRALEGLTIPARVVLPYGSERVDEGYAWFGTSTTDEEFGDVVRHAATRLAPFLRELLASRPTVGKAIVVGFSQGGIMSYALAVLHPELVRAAVPVAGTIPRSLVPSAWPPSMVMPRITAIHGTTDEVVGIDGDRASVARLRTVGFRIELTELPGVGHELSASVRDALTKAVTRASQE